MPNNANDLQTITSLFDRIPAGNGGTAATPGLWSSDRTLLIGQVTAAIMAFQTLNRRSVIDGVVDPGGGTLRLMDRLAWPGPVSASVEMEDVNSHNWVVANPLSLDGTAPLDPLAISPALTRKLVKVEGSSIKWFGVVIPRDDSGSINGGPPLIFFTPSPWQGGYQDPGYDSFTSWRNLWDKYTSAMGSQLVSSGARQILVIPFYKNSQTGKLGSFLSNWREVITAVLTASINSVDPFYLRNNYQFDEIYTASFSNGITSHQNFHMHGAGASGMTTVSFDLDGQAAGSNWHPSGGVAYFNTPAIGGVNPNGRHWHVGGRFIHLRRNYTPRTDHNLCPFLLMHGLRRFG